MLLFLRAEDTMFDNNLVILNNNLTPNELLIKKAKYFHFKGPISAVHEAAQSIYRARVQGSANSAETADKIINVGKLLEKTYGGFKAARSNNPAEMNKFLLKEAIDKYVKFTFADALGDYGANEISDFFLLTIDGLAVPVELLSGDTQSAKEFAIKVYTLYGEKFMRLSINSWYLLKAITDSNNMYNQILINMFLDEYYKYGEDLARVKSENNIKDQPWFLPQVSDLEWISMQYFTKKIKDLNLKAGGMTLQALRAVESDIQNIDIMVKTRLLQKEQMDYIAKYKHIFSKLDNLVKAKIYDTALLEYYKKKENDYLTNFASMNLQISYIRSIYNGKVANKFNTNKDFINALELNEKIDITKAHITYREYIQILHSAYKKLFGSSFFLRLYVLDKSNSTQIFLFYKRRSEQYAEESMKKMCGEIFLAHFIRSTPKTYLLNPDVYITNAFAIGQNHSFYKNSSKYSKYLQQERNNK